MAGASANGGNSGAGSHSQNISDDFGSLSASAVWKGENESDAELMEAFESPVGDAGVWTEEEAYKVYREKLVQLRDLYVGQFDHMSHVLQEKRRQFLLQWQYASRRRKPDEQTVTKESREDIAYRRYRRKSGEEKLLEHKLKKRRYAASLDYFLKKDDRESHKHHNQYLLKMHHRLAQNQVHCNNYGCENKCLPFSNKCSRHVCDDSKQLLYTKCSYIYPSGIQCTNPIPKYLDPLLCGGHCDNIRPPESYVEGPVTNVRQKTTLTCTLDSLDTRKDDHEEAAVANPEGSEPCPKEAVHETKRLDSSLSITVQQGKE